MEILPINWFGGAELYTVKDPGGKKCFEEKIREYLMQGKNKLEKDLSGTREAIKIVAEDKTRDFIRTTDKGLDKYEREYLTKLLITSMYQAFCYGYGIGKMEGTTGSKVYL